MTPPRKRGGNAADDAASDDATGGAVGMDPAPLYPDEEERIKQILAKMPPDTRTRLHRLDDVYKRFVTHGILSPAEVNQEWVAARFGGGTYRIKIIDNTGTIRGTTTWIIPGRYKGVGGSIPGIDAEPGQDAPAAPVAAGGGHATTRELLDHALTDRVLQMMNRDTGRGGTDLAGIAAIVTALGATITPLLVPMVERMVKGGGGLSAELAAIRAELRDARTNPPTPLGDSMRGVQDVLRIAKALKGGDDDKGSTLDRIMDRVPDVLAMFTGRAGPAPVAGAVAALPPGDAVTPAQGGIPVLPDGSTDWVTVLRGFRDQLLYLANTGWDADYCADFVVRTLPSVHQGLLAEYLRRDDADALAVQAIPELGAFATWRPAFLKDLRTMLADDDPEGEA